MADFIKYNHTLRSTTFDNSRGVNNRTNVPNIFHILGLIVIGLILLAFVGCKTPQLPTLPNSSDRSHDSIRTEYVHDSITVDRWHTKYIKGDTVYIHDSVFRDRWHNRDVHDSVYINCTDTIYQPVQIEKQGSAFLRNSGIALWVLIALFVAGAIIGIILKFAK